MKTLKFLLIFAISIVTFTSCVEDNDPSALNDDGPNLAGFRSGSQTVGGIANGDTYDFDIQMEVKGPTFTDLTSDVVVNIDVDPSSTAIEGTHFSFDSKTITLTKDGNYLGLLPITMLSAGIMAPLDVAPVLYLTVTDASSGDNVIGNGKLLKLSFNYLCFSNLAGNYNLTMEASNGWIINFPNELITEVGTGYYKTQGIYRWAYGSIAPDHGFNFFDVCNVISIPDQDLAQGFYSNDVFQTAPGEVDPVTGNLLINYTVSFGSGDVTCVGTYIKL